MNTPTNSERDSVESTVLFGTLLLNGGKVLRYGDTVLDTDHQVHHHLGNRTQSPPEEKWIDWKVIPSPSPTFVRMPNAGEHPPR